MKITDFCQVANQNPMFDKKKGGLRTEITPELLEEVEFVKGDYQDPHDLMNLYCLLKERRKEAALGKRLKLSKEAEELMPKEAEAYRKVMDILAAEYEIGKRDPSSYSFMTVFRFIPAFNRAVASIRKKEGIDPKKVKEALNKKFSGKGAQAVLPVIIGHMQRGGKFVVEEMSMRAEISQWIDDHFPAFKESVTESCLNSLPFLLPILKWDFIDYILYDAVGRITPGNLGKEKVRLPEVHPISRPDHFFLMLGVPLSETLRTGRPLDYAKARRDMMENFDNFIVMKIHPETPISEVKKKLRAVQEAQKRFPAYQLRYWRLTKHDYKRLVGHLIAFYLRREEGMTAKGANKIVKALGFDPIPPRIFNREKARIEKLLGTQFSS